MGFGDWWLMGVAAKSVDLWVSVANGFFSSFFFFFFWWFVGCGFYDQRRAQMVVTSLGGVTSFSIGLGVKNSRGA